MEVRGRAARPGPLAEQRQATPARPGWAQFVICAPWTALDGPASSTGLPSTPVDVAADGSPAVPPSLPPLPPAARERRASPRQPPPVQAQGQHPQAGLQAGPAQQEGTRGRRQPRRCWHQRRQPASGHAPAPAHCHAAAHSGGSPAARHSAPAGPRHARGSIGGSSSGICSPAARGRKRGRASGACHPSACGPAPAQPGGHCRRGRRWRGEPAAQASLVGLGWGRVGWQTSNLPPATRNLPPSSLRYSCRSCSSRATCTLSQPCRTATVDYAAAHERLERLRATADRLAQPTAVKVSC